MARPNWEFIRVDVLLPDHPKLDGLSGGEKWLLIEIWCWCGQHLTDGFVRDTKWKQFGTPRFRQKLLNQKLAERVDGGYQMHDFLDHQRSRAEVEEVRAKRSVAGKRSAAVRAKARAGVQQNVEQFAEHGVERDVPPDDASSSASSSTNRRQIRLASASGGEISTAPSGPPPEGESPAQTGSAPQHPVEQNGSKPATEAEAEAEVLKADAVDQSADRNGRTITDLIISEIRKTTGRTVDAGWAGKIRSHILAGRSPSDPAAYVRQVIRNEPNPRNRFLPVY